MAKEIGAIIDMSTAYGRGALRGVGEYARQDGRWRVSHIPSQAIQWDRPLDGQLKGIAGVVIQSPVDQPPLTSLAELKLPAVCVADHAESYGMPTVRPDHRAVGAMAAGYYLGLGFRNLAYVGRSGEPYACLRYEGFVLAVRNEGIEPPAYWIPRPNTREDWGKALGQWLQELPKPVGVLACDDSCARFAAHFAQNRAIAVPEHVALLGVDDDAEACEMGTPSLSSIMTDSTRIGDQAMQVLTELLDGRKPPTGPILIPPVSVTTRQSTDTVPTADELVQRVLRLLRDRCASLENAAAAARSLGVPRDELEARLMAALGRGLAAQMRLVRVERAKHLLRATDLSLGKIAHESGFASPASFARDFRQEVQLAPSDYRLKARGQLQDRKQPG